VLCQADVLASEPELGTLWREIKALRSSTSWRVTAPLRILGDALKRSS